MAEHEVLGGSSTFRTFRVSLESDGGQTTAEWVGRVGVEKHVDHAVVERRAARQLDRFALEHPAGFDYLVLEHRAHEMRSVRFRRRLVLCVLSMRVEFV